MQGIYVKELTLRDGKLANLVIEGGTKELVEIATQNVEKAKAGITHMQRPLARKFNSIISKLQALYDDVVQHEEYVQDLIERKKERHHDAEFNRFMRSGKTQAAMASLLRGDV